MEVKTDTKQICISLYVQTFSKTASDRGGLLGKVILDFYSK